MAFHNEAVWLTGVFLQNIMPIFVISFDTRYLIPSFCEFNAAFHFTKYATMLQYKFILFTRKLNLWSVVKNGHTLASLPQIQ
jgi:hypothetical protein